MTLPDAEGCFVFFHNFSCPPPPPATPTPFIFAQDVITEDYTCASISVAMNVGALADTLCQGNLDPLLSNQPLTIYCQVYTYTLNASGTPDPYLRYNVPAYVLLEIMEEEQGSIPLELPDPRPTPVLSPVEGCELPCPPGCECSSGLRRVGKDGYEEDDEPSEALILYPDNWTQTSEYVREYQEIDKRTFHKPGDRDCVAIDRHQWMD